MPDAQPSTEGRKLITWQDPAVFADATARMAGREFLEAIIEGELPPPPFARLIGAELASVGDGEAVFRCSPDESMYNPLGLVHGGVLCALLDSAAGCAVQTLLPAGSGCSSIEIKVSFLQPVLVGMGEVEVRGRALRVGGRVAFAKADARDRQGRLLGHATTSLSVVRS